jgi:hypothetical protein
MMGKLPKDATCEAMYVDEEDRGPAPRLRKCGKAATRTRKSLDWDTYLCEECDDKMARKE